MLMLILWWRNRHPQVAPQDKKRLLETIRAGHRTFNDIGTTLGTPWPDFYPILREMCLEGILAETVEERNGRTVIVYHPVDAPGP